MKSRVRIGRVGIAARISMAVALALTAIAFAACTDAEPVDVDATVAAELESQGELVSTVIAAVEATRLARPTETPTPAPSPTSTATLAPSPTLTPAPTATPSPTPTPTATPTPVPTPSPVPTPIPSTTAPPTEAVPLSLSVADLVEQVGPSVVKILTNRNAGSGVVIQVESNGGFYVLTNAHVIDFATQITVFVRDSKQLQGQLIVKDTTRDLAILSVCCDAEIGAVPYAATVRIGEPVAALGYPLGVDTLRVSQGIVSGKQFNHDTQRSELQTDAALNPGNSGGPLLLLDGTIAGINTYGVTQSSDGTAVEGIGFAVGVDTLKEVVPEMLKGRLVPAATPTPHPYVAEGVYTNPMYRWRITVPDGWIVDDSDPGSVLIYNNRIATFILVAQTPIPPGYGISDFVDQYTLVPPPDWQSFSMIAKGFIFREPTEPDRPRITGYEFQYTFTRNRTAYKGFTQWFVFGGLKEAYMILPEYVWSDPYLEQYRLELQQMFSSFTPAWS